MSMYVSQRPKKGESRIDEIWKDLPSIMDYYAPVISRTQQYANTSTESLMRLIGRTIGQNAKEMFNGNTPEDLLSEFAQLWTKLEIGRIELEKTDPVTFTVHDCMICEQIPGYGETSPCAFHEGFFDAILKARLGTRATIRQLETSEGPGHTRNRTFQITFE